MNRLHDLCARLLEHARIAQDCLIGKGLWDYGDDDGLPDKVQAALKEAENAWQPISMAPKDGTEILAWNGHEQQIVWWSERMNAWTFNDDWEIDDPTHWQPLPEPPATPDTTGDHR